MSLSTRLILLLTAAVGIVMTLAGFYLLRQRQEILARAWRNELNAHAVTLQLALEDSYRAGRISDAQRLIDRLSENPRVFSVILFDEEGRPAMLSNSLLAGEAVDQPEVRVVVATGQPVELFHHRRGKEVFSVILPVRISAARRGAVEISQPTDFIKADSIRARRDIALVTLALFAAIILLVAMMMRHNLLRPIRELLMGAKAVGQGDLAFRVIVSGSGSEINELAREFNRMAGRLAEQKVRVERESEERLALERELRHSERLATVGRLAAGVAHEMGAPLNVIKGRVEMMRDRPEAPLEKRLRNLEIIGAQTDAITDIVRQLLTLARPFHLRRESLALSSLFIGVVELLEDEAQQAGVSIIASSGEGACVDGDRTLLHQALMNLCVNALHAMENQGGYLTIELTTDSPVTTENWDGAKFVGLRVLDTGPGIAPDYLPHVFDPFFTTKEVGKGTGLGLSVSRRIVEEHGGWIEAANRSEGGAAFTCWLPRSASVPESKQGVTPGGEKK
ncbi:MAG: HAMP domain-containing sensor histidine kinase [Acidobacteriota bacterium]